MTTSPSPKSPPELFQGKAKWAVVGLLLVLVIGGPVLRWQARRAGQSAGAALRGAAQRRFALQHAAQKPGAAPQHVSQASVAPSLAVKGGVKGRTAALVAQAPQPKAAQAIAPHGTPAAPAARPAASAPAGSVARAAQADAGFQDADLGILKPQASQYAYNADNRRDPFQSLLDGDFEAEEGENGRPLVDIGDLNLMGVMTGNNELYAMMEDSKHHGYTLRVGDPVLNGRVTRIEDNCITFNISSYGENQTVRLRLKPQALQNRK